MEHIGETLKKKTRTSTSKANTDTWSGGAKDGANSKPDSTCPLCQGARFVHPTLASGKTDFSRVIECQCTAGEKDRERQSGLVRYSNLGQLNRLTFDNLLPQGRSGLAINQRHFQQAYDAARSFADNPQGWLVFVGPSGSGKTHLAAAIAAQRIKQSKPALYKTTPDLLDDLRSAYSPEREIDYSQSFDILRNAPLLILDDLGIHSSTSWVQEKLDQLLNHRYSQQLPTVITTATPVEQLDERLRSRLADDALCRIFTLDRNQAHSLYYQWAEGMELQKRMRFENFDWRRINLPPQQRQSLENAYRLAMSYAKSPENWLVFQGVTGCGKTHLASAIVNYCYDANKPALFIVVPDFLDHLRSTFSPDSSISYDRLFESVKTAPLLVLDDFGEQAATPWAQEKLYQVINYRYNAQLPTVITTRCSLSDIDSRISSRFVDPRISTPFNINVPDYRGDNTSIKTARSPRARKQRP